MKTVFLISGLFLILNVAEAQQYELLPDDFGTNAVVHVKKLCEYGVRSAGSVAEQKTITYLTENLNKNGLNVVLDTISYMMYKLDKRSFYFNNKMISLKTAYIEDYLKDTIEFGAYCIKRNGFPNKEEIRDKVIITTVSRNSVLLTEFKPKAVLVIDTNVYDTLQINENIKYNFKFIGSIQSWLIKSYNVIATYNYKFPVDSNIIINAHWDSEPGVGAGDNASGTAALIELSKFYKNLLPSFKYNLVFLFTGSEEHDIIGSSSYILNHHFELNKCKLEITVDDISYLKPYIETTNYGTNNSYSDTLQTLSAIEYKGSKSFLLSSFREIYGNRKNDLEKVKWVRGNFLRSMNEIRVNYQDGGCCSGTDANSFQYIGIPFISFTSTDPADKVDNANTIKDVYNDSFKQAIQLNMKIVNKVIRNFNK